MEYAVFITKHDHLKYCGRNFSRLYYGNEFCPRLLPAPAELAAVLDFARPLDFTLVTPYLTDPELDRLRPLLEMVADTRPESEVVCNDWGVFQVLREDYPTLTPVMGRLLNKMKRGPRLAPVMDRLPAASLEYFRSSNLSVPLFRRFLRDNGVRRAEFDNVLQGIDFSFDDMALSLYLPFAYVTTTRACLVNACDQPEKRDVIGIFPCRRECQRYTFYLQNQVMPVALVRQGNTLFFKNEALPPELGPVDRLVIEPEIPM
ncbi:MAG: hypothetical protein V1780_06455 [Chloroflexota bacterium]